MAHSGFVHLNGNILAAVDVETTGRRPGWHEIIQIGIQPLDSNLNPSKEAAPFYHFIKPEHPERAEKRATAVHRIDINRLMLHSPDKWKVADLLDEWWSALDKPFQKTLVPLAQNWQYEAGFLKEWLGVESFNQFFHPYARDTMTTAIFLNDLAYRRGLELPFNQVSLRYFCHKFNIVNDNPHDALADARAEAAVYKALLDMDLG